MSFLGGWIETGRRYGMRDDELGSLGVDTYRRSQEIEIGRKTCGNRNCQTVWGKPWKNQRRPIFEGDWRCGARCLEAMVRSAVRRELGDGPVAGVGGHRHRVPLGLVMLAQGWITHPQLRRALDSQKACGSGRIGEWLQQECGVSEETVTRGLSVQWNCPVLSTDAFAPKEVALAMPRLFVEEFGLLPLRIGASRLLYLGFEDRLDASAAFSLERMTELRVESGLVPRETFAAARERLLQCEFVAAERVAVRTSEEVGTKVVDTLEKLQPIASRLVRMHQHFWLRTWLETGTKGSAGMVPESSEDVLDTIFTVGFEA